MPLRLTLAVLAALTAVRVVVTVAPAEPEADAWIAAAHAAPAVDGAVRVGAALVPVRTTGPGGAPVVATATVPMR